MGKNVEQRQILPRMGKILLVTIAFALLTSITADAQWRSKTHDVYNALTIPAGVDIKVGDFSEYWEGVFETVKGTDGTIFCGVEYSGNVFETHNGGKWTGPDDHQTCFAILWDPEAIYIAIAVDDDEHEHANPAAWNGDGAQLAFEMSGKRTAGGQMFLYNIGLDDKAKDILLDALNENPGGAGIVPDEDIAIVRNEDEKETYYELRFTAEELQVKGKKFSEGFKFGLHRFEFKQKLAEGKVSVSTMEIKGLGKMDRKAGAVGIRILLSSERIRNIPV